MNDDIFSDKTKQGETAEGGADSRRVRILPPEEPAAQPQPPVRDFSAHYRPLNTAQPPSENKKNPPADAAERYRSAVLISSEQKSAKQKENKSRILFTAVLCAATVVISVVCGTLSARITLARQEEKAEEASLSDIYSIRTTRPSLTGAGAAVSTLTESTEANTDASTASESAQSEAPTVVASTDAAVAKTARDIYNEVASGVVGVTARINLSNTLFGQSFVGESSGSGFIISDDGYILTNYHVVEGGSNIRVSFFDGSERDAELVGFDQDNDIAVLKTEASRLNAVTLGDSDELSVGDTVLIIGNPLGMLSFTLTSGVVSALDRELTDDNSSIRMFQTDAAINSGNSGGPAFNMDGEVVGIATSKYADSAIEGLSFCIPINDVKAAVSDIIAYGYVRGRPLLGTSVQTLSASSAARYHLPEGVYIVAVGAGSAAQQAGLSDGAVITAVGGESVASVQECKSALEQYSAGDRIPLTVYQDGESKEVTLTAQEKVPSSPRTAYSNVYDI